MMVKEKIIPEEQISEFVSQLQKAAGNNLRSVILYGSAANGEYHRGFSNINLLCILRESSFAVLRALSPACTWWNRQGHVNPLILSAEEVERSADVFVIEFLDMQHRHRVLFGEDVFQSLHIPLQLHKAQVEHQLREKLILLRQAALLHAEHPKPLWDLLLRSFPAFLTLFRHALMVLGEPAPDSQRATLQALPQRITFDPAVFLQLLEIREGKVDRKQFDVTGVCARYLEGVQHVTAVVDRMLDSTGLNNL